MFCFTVASMIIIDMLILGGKMKLVILALGNTSNYSPFSTDGQSNWVLVLFLIGTIIFIGWLLSSVRGIEEEEPKEECDDGSE